MPASARSRLVRPEKIKEWRQKLHLGQLELARKLGYSRSTVAHVENGTTPASPRFLDTLEHVFGVTRDRFYSWGWLCLLLAL